MSSHDSKEEIAKPNSVPEVQQTSQTSIGLIEENEDEDLKHPTPEASRKSLRQSKNSIDKIRPSSSESLFPDRQNPEFDNTFEEDEIIPENIKKEEQVAPDASLLVTLADEDAREFEDPDLEMDMDEFLPQSKFQDKSFLKLREFFEGIISDLENVQKLGIPLEEIKEEFYFVWNAIQKSHDNLESLLHRDLQLSVEVADTMAKTRNIIKIAEDHPDKALILSRRLETAWNLVDISESEEKKNAARLEELESEIAALNKNINAAANMEGRTELNELIKIRRKLADERDSLTKDMSRLKASLALLHERKSRGADKKLEFHDIIKFAEEEAVAQEEALKRESTRKHKIEKQMKETVENIALKSQELVELENHLSMANIKTDEIERTLRDQRVINDFAARDADAAQSKQEKLRGDVEAQIALIERLTGDAYKRQAELKKREDEVTMMKMEGARIERQKNSSVKKCEALQDTLDALENERESLRNKILQLERDLDKAQGKLAESKKEVEELTKQRNLVNRNLQRAFAVTGEHENQMKISAVAINNLEGEVDGFKREIVGQTETIYRLERERDYYSHEATKLAHVVTSKVDIIKRLDISILEHKRRVSELEDSFKSIQQSYEAVAVEKLHYERTLRDTANEITQCTKAIRDIKFEKQGLEYRETDVRNMAQQEEERRDQLTKQTVVLKAKAEKMKHFAVDVQRESEALEAERTTLSLAISTAENDISKQKYYASGAESRKENYHRKLMKKEQELRETWERWRTLHSIVRIGAYHYRNIMKEIREIRQSILGLRNEQLNIKGATNHVEQLQQEISALESCIAKESCMVNALEEELKRPINIHRWRVLEAVDPDAYNLVKKLNVVTKRLVDHNEQIRKQNLKISYHERTYVDIKGVTRHLPGLETPEERQYYEVLFEAKKEQLEFLKHEMYANEAQTAFFRTQVSQLNEKMEELKKAYFRKMEMEQCSRRRGTKSCAYLHKPTPTIAPYDEEEEEEEWPGEDDNNDISYPQWENNFREKSESQIRGKQNSYKSFPYYEE